MNQVIRFDLYPANLHPQTRQVAVRDLKVGDFICLSYCSVPTYARVGLIEEHPDGSRSILDLDRNGTTYRADQLDYQQTILDPPPALEAWPVYDEEE